MVKKNLQSLPSTESSFPKNKIGRLSGGIAALWNRFSLKKICAIAGCVLPLLCLLSWGSTSPAQDALQSLESAAKKSINDVNVPEVGDPECVDCSSSKAKKVKSAKSVHKSPDYNAMIAETILQSMVTSMFSTGTGTDSTHQYEALMAQQAEAQAKAQHAMALQQQKEAVFKAKHNQMMQAYKQPGGSSGTAFKSLTDSGSGSMNGYKSLDDAETLASNARMPFDTPPEQTVDSDGMRIGEATPFFGDTMPLKDIQLLVNPENDPRIVDLREAKSYIVANLKKENVSGKGSKTPDNGHDNGEPIVEKPDCAKLSRQLKGYIVQRDRFQKTVALAQEQVDTWQAANRNAMLNVAMDGINYFTGQLLEGMTNRGKAAARLEQIYKKNADRMVKDGIDIQGIEEKIDHLKRLSSAGEMADMISNVSDWNDFVEHGMSGLISQMTDSNREIEGMLEEPGMQKYLGESESELNALLDISKIAASNAVFGKWVAKKIPIVAGIELAVNQTYNAMDWFLSFNRIMDANNINGKVLDTAKRIQKNIDDTVIELKGCSI